MTNSMEGISTPLAYYIINQYLEMDQRDWSKEYLERARSSNGHLDDVEERKSARVDGTEPTKNHEDYSGTYYDPMYGNIIVSKENDKLRLTFENAPKLGATLTHWHYDTYQINWDEEHAWFDFGTVAFELSNNLEVERLTFDVPNYDIFFHELNPEKVD